MQIAVAVLFIVTYVLLLALPKFKPYISIGMAVVITMVVVFCQGSGEKLSSFVNILGSIQWNALMVIIGMMGIVDLFIKSDMPAFLADKLAKISKSPKMAIIMLAVFSGLISAITDNVATVLMVVPVALSICKKSDINPIAPIIAISISANLQGAATLVGDTTCIMLANHLGLSFLDFFVYDGTAGMFFVVEISAVIATIVLAFLLPRYKDKKMPELEVTKVKFYYPTVLLCLLMAILIALSFIPIKNEILGNLIQGIVCMGIFITGLICETIRTKSGKVYGEVFKKGIDYETLLLLLGLFFIIGGVKEAGIIDIIGQFLGKISGGNIFVLYTILVFGSVLISAFIDNIPYVATMLPVIASMSASLGIANPIVLYFGMLSGATLGGNITPIGASANVTSLGILKKEGYQVKSLTFMKYSIPFTLTAVLCGYGLVWAFYGL